MYHFMPSVFFSEILLLVVVSTIIREVWIKIIFTNLSRIFSFANVTQKYLAGSARRLIHFGTRLSASLIAVVLSALRRTDDIFFQMHWPLNISVRNKKRKYPCLRRQYRNSGIWRLMTKRLLRVMNIGNIIELSALHFVFRNTRLTLHCFSIQQLKWL